MTDLAALLREARSWLHHGEDNCLNDNAKWEHADLLNRIDAALAELEAEPERKPEIPHECRTCDWLDKHGPLVPQGRPFCEQFRFCPPVEQYRHFGCADWQPKDPK